MSKDILDILPNNFVILIFLNYIDLSIIFITKKYYNILEILKHLELYLELLLKLLILYLLNRMYLKVENTDAAKQLSELLKDGDWMVLYYAEWCGHCNAMKPEWEKVVEKFKETGKINIADVKSDFIDSLLHKPKIEGFPTINMYNKGREVAKFEDERSAAKIEKFAMSNSTKTYNKTKPQHITENKNIINLEELSSESITKPTTTNQLDSFSVPLILNDNTNDVKKLSISQLKDEIFKSNRKYKNTSGIKANSNKLINIPRASRKVKINTSNLDMLLHPPMPSIKASKKKNNSKTKIKNTYTKIS